MLRYLSRRHKTLMDESEQALYAAAQQLVFAFLATAFGALGYFLDAHGRPCLVLKHEDLVDPDGAQVIPSLKRRWTGPSRHPGPPPTTRQWLTFGNYR